MRLRFSRIHRGILAAVMAVTALVPIALAEPALGQVPAPVYIAVDSSLLLSLVDPARKVAVANPSIADVQVISPSQLLIVGKASGVTSLMIFSGKGRQSYNLIVHPSSMAAAGTSATLPPPHAVLVQRGDKMSEHLFTRGPDEHWLELGQVKPETDVKK